MEDHIIYSLRIEKETIEALSLIAERMAEEQNIDIKTQDVARKAMREFVKKNKKGE